MLPRNPHETLRELRVDKREPDRHLALEEVVRYERRVLGDAGVLLELLQALRERVEDQRGSEDGP